MMFKWLKKIWHMLKPNNKYEVILRMIGVISLILLFMVAGNYIELNTIIQIIYIAVITSFCLIARCNKTKNK